MKNNIKVILMIFAIVLASISIIAGPIIWHFTLNRNNNFNMKSVTKENLQFYFTAEPRTEDKRNGSGESNIYLCDVISNKYILAHSSEKYYIKYFCADKNIIYFIGEYKQDGIEKYDLVKLEDNSEKLIAELDVSVSSLDMINNKLYFTTEAISDTAIVYSCDLSSTNIEKVFEYKFDFKFSVHDIDFISESEVYITGRKENAQYTVAYLISDSEVIEINNALTLEKFEDKLYIYFYHYFGIYDTNTKEVTTLKKFGDNDFFMLGELVINNAGKYAIVDGNRNEYKYTLTDQMAKRYITIFNMETYKQAAVKCIDFRKNFYQVHSYTWVE